MIINGFCQKYRQGQVFRGLAQKLIQSSPAQRQHVLRCLPEKENSAATLPTAATRAGPQGNVQHPPPSTCESGQVHTH